MHKARKEIKKRLPEIDLIIEVMDARIPYSSENPLVAKFRENKPCIKILNKADLADPALTQKWLDFFELDENTRAIATSAKIKNQVQSIPNIIKKFLPQKVQAEKPIRTFILGIPNVGKSTIINILAGRTIAKVGDEPAVTKRQQQIYLNNNIVLSDTPGILWPRMENKNSGYRLGATGAIRDTAMDYEEVALFILSYLSAYYPEQLMNRYKLNALEQKPEIVLENIGKKRGCLRSGGIVDLYKAADILISDIRSGALGAITFESPEMITAELAEIESVQL